VDLLVEESGERLRSDGAGCADHGDLTCFLAGHDDDGLLEILERVGLNGICGIDLKLLDDVSFHGYIGRYLYTFSRITVTLSRHSML
jgi:hypothetical protein